MMNSTIKKRREGYTLAEVVVSSLLLALGFAAAWSLMGSHLRANAFSGDFTTATTLAQDKFEEIIQQEYDAIDGGSDVVNNITRTWSVTEDAALEAKTVQLTASWVGVDGETHQIQLTHLVSKAGVGEE